MAVTEGEHGSASFVILSLVFRREGLMWTGECRELGTATYGRSLPKVRDELAELVALHLEGSDLVWRRAALFQARGEVACPGLVHGRRILKEVEAPVGLRHDKVPSTDGRKCHRGPRNGAATQL